MTTDKRICEPPEMCRHQSALVYFTSLVIDMKLQLLGHVPTEPITMARLNEASKHVQDIQQCTEPMKKY